MEEKALQPNAGHCSLRKGRISLPGQVYHVTTTTVSRTPFFADHRAAQAAVHCFEDISLLCDTRMLAWVLMPDHAHWLLELGEDRSLQSLVDVLKSFSARNVNLALGRHGPIWARGYHDRAMLHEQDIAGVAHYILANPVRSGLTERVDDYPYCSTL